MDFDSLLRADVIDNQTGQNADTSLATTTSSSCLPATRPQVDFDWDKARTFMVAVETGSYTRAARQMGTTQPTIGRQISALEEQLGCKLLDRWQGNIVLTQMGQQLYQSIRDMAQIADKISRQAWEFSATLSGRVCLQANEMLAAEFLAPFYQTVFDKFPQIALEISESCQQTLHMDSGADMAMQFDVPSDPDMIVRRLGNLEFALFGSKDNMPTCKQTSVYLLGVSANNEYLPAEWKQKLTEARNSERFILSQARHGSALAIMPATVGDRDPALARPNGVGQSCTLPVWLAARQDLKTNARIRHIFNAICDHMEEALS